MIAIVDYGVGNLFSLASSVRALGAEVCVTRRADDPLFRYIRDGEYVYYVHSYYAKHCDASTLATSDYSIPVTGAVRRGLVYGTQFHPEKSGDTGLRLLRAFCEL